MLKPQMVASATPPLNPGSVETILTVLHQQFEYRPEWVERYFQRAAEDGRFAYSNIDRMNATQAQAVRQVLLDKIAYAWRQARKPSNSLLEDPDVVKEWKLKIALYVEALRDLARVFDLRLPTEL